MEIMERYAVRTMSFIMGTVFGVLAILIVLAMLADLTQAATYNTFFNNVEQGPHSQSNPSLQVNGKGFSATKRSGKNSGQDPELISDEESEEDGSDVLTVQTNQPPSRTGGTVVAGSSAEDAKDSSSSEYPLFPMRLTAGVLSQKATFSTQELKSGPINYTLKGKDSANGGIAGLTLYPLRDLGVHVFAGASSGRKSFYGGEAQFVPFRFGVFGLENLIEAGFLAGVSTLGKDVTDSGSGRLLKGTVHGGLHGAVNLGRRYGVVTALRTNVTDRSTVKYWLADIGMSVRF